MIPIKKEDIKREEGTVEEGEVEDRITMKEGAEDSQEEEEAVEEDP